MKRRGGKVSIKNTEKRWKIRVVGENLSCYYFSSQVQCCLIFEGPEAARSRELHLALN